MHVTRLGSHARLGNYKLCLKLKNFPDLRAAVNNIGNHLLRMLKDITCTFTNIVGTGSSTEAGQPADTLSLTIGYRKEEGI